MNGTTETRVAKTSRNQLSSTVGDIMTFGHDSLSVAEYMLWRASQAQNPLTPMQVLKLVYIAHGWMLGLYGRPLIDESVEAWQYGPVIPSLYHRYKKYGSRFINDGPSQQPSGFSGAERRVLDQVWSGYGHRSGVALSSLTHQPGTPWDFTIKRLGRGAVIPNDLIEEHYRGLGRQKAS
jgi:uncharacterized phage-associated protein